jgi:hypothetical protein
VRLSARRIQRIPEVLAGVTYQGESQLWGGLGVGMQEKAGPCTRECIMRSGSLRVGAWWLIHALRPKANPLRRWVDRVTAVIMLVLLAGVLAAVPVAAVAGTVLYEQSAKSAAAVASTRHPVEATVASDPAVRVVGGDSQTQTTEVWADVRWVGADGLPRVAAAEVEQGSVVGSKVPLWVDVTEHVTTPPPTASQVMTTAVMSAVMIMLTLQGLCIGMIFSVRLVAEAYARRAWQREWEIVEPRWTRHKQ